MVLERDSQIVVLTLGGAPDDVAMRERCTALVRHQTAVHRAKLANHSNLRNPYRYNYNYNDGYYLVRLPLRLLK
jgi:hypothetical protein